MSDLKNFLNEIDKDRIVLAAVGDEGSRAGRTRRREVKGVS